MAADPNYVGDLPKTVKNGDEHCIKCVKNGKVSNPTNEPWVDIHIDMSMMSS